MVNLVRILSYAISGSILLDRLLGPHRQPVSTVLENQRGSWGEQVVECSLWSQVSEQLMERMYTRTYGSKQDAGELNARQAA